MLPEKIDRETFAAALRLHRDRLGLTQKEAAKEVIDISTRTLENWERCEGGEPLQVTMEGALARLKFARKRK